MKTPNLSTREKALALNLDARTYGTIAEIGGGQEVARWLFKVGGAAGTVAKTISAYDMAVSDGIYGPAQRYVSRQRLEAMLEKEFELLTSQLGQARGDGKCFFAFANTVATRRFGAPGHGRGWVGVRFQARPHEEPSQVMLHAHLLDALAEREQEALGVLGINVIHAAFFLRDNPADFISALADGLTRERVEIDTIKFSGPAFRRTDNRLASLQLVEQGFTDAAMFTAAGDVVQPSEVLHKRPILLERGSFRPATKLTVDLLERAHEAFVKDPQVQGQDPVVLAEMTLRSLVPGPEVGHRDFLARADTLAALGYDVLVSRFQQFHEVAEYLAAYTDRPIGLAVGVPVIKKLVEETYYTGLPGGVLEGAGRLFQRAVKMYVYPTRDPATGRVETVDDVAVPPPWQHLHRLLDELGRVEPLRPSDEALLSIRTPDVLALIQNGDGAWESMVPAKVAAIIKAKGLFSREPKAAEGVAPQSQPVAAR